MRILIIAMMNSIHTARWINQINKQSWKIYCYPSTNEIPIHPELQNITYCYSYTGYSKQPNQSVTLKGNILFSNSYISKFFKYLNKNHFDLKVQELKNLILELKPDIVHTLEIQSAGYLTLAVKQKYFQNKPFPKWIVTNWGSDIYFYGRLSEHKEKIQLVLNHCDYYSCECYRDIDIAKNFGFKGKTLPVFPNTGGFDLDDIQQYRQPGLTSDRKVIMLKGYQTWAGRSLFALRALERCADLLDNYTIVIYSASDDVKLAAKLFSSSTGITVKILPINTPHLKMLKYHGKARISIGVSISDAISTSLLEAIVMGSFPIQSWTSCANEWITDGETGLLIPPEDPEIIEQAIRRALTDDELVNSGVKKNIEMAKIRLDSKIIQPMAINFYETVFNEL